MERYLIILIYCLIFSQSCLETNNQTEKQDAKSLQNVGEVKCNENFDSVLLKISQDFKPRDIDLSRSLSAKTSEFILNVDTICLRKQRVYQVFVGEILAKLYLYHLQCCNQGYDLLSMRQGAAAIIINEFMKLAGYNARNPEFLNSFKIVDCINSSTDLLQNPRIQPLLIQIKNEQQRIEKGVF